MTEFVKSVSSEVAYAQRLQACHDAQSHIAHMPVELLGHVLTTTADLMVSDASLEARQAGFMILTALLRRSEAPVDLHRKCLATSITAIDPRGTEDQFETLQAALSSPSGLCPLAAEVIEFALCHLMPQFEAQNAARRRVRSETRAGGHKETPAEERGMYKMLDFCVTVIESEPTLFPESRLVLLFELILAIAEKASATGTVERVCLIIRSVVSVSRIPSTVLRRCLEDLCAIYNTTQRLKDVTWECLELLLKSEHQDEHEIVAIVLETIGLPPQERQSHTVCGAMRTARFIMTSQGRPHIPSLTFDQFLNALLRVNFGSRRIRREVLRTIGILLSDSSSIQSAIKTLDWQPLFGIIDRAIEEKRTGTRARRSMEALANEDFMASDANETSTKASDPEEILADQVTYIADALARLWPDATNSQHQHISKFLQRSRGLLAEDFIATFILDLSHGQFLAGGDDKFEHLVELVDLFAMGDEPSRRARCLVIQLMQESISNDTSEVDQARLHHTVTKLLIDFEAHKDLQVANDLADLVVAEFQLLSTSSASQRLTECLELIWPLISVADDPVLPADAKRPTDFDKNSINSVSLSLVELFLRSIASRPDIAVPVYNLLVSISNAGHLSASARLPAVRLLTRLRCDLQHRIFVIASPDIQGLEATLCRTETTVPTHGLKSSTRQHTWALDDTVEGRKNRVSSVSMKTHSTSRSNPRSSARVERISKPKPPLWLYPGGVALPIDPPSDPSSDVHVYVSGASKTAGIHLGDWLANAISMYQQPNADWEILSYILVHLPSQLSNRELFISSFPHIRMLRRILVDQLLSGDLYQPAESTGVRKGDLALCLYHALIMLVGYSDTIEREEQERIVQAIVDGVTKWERTARFCIQSLTICALILPAAMTNWLSAILQRMSQMITQSHLSVDILEFLASLARHRKLYVNFREEEYRTVFAICVRYLEHSREQRLRLLTPADRTSSAPSTTTLTSTERPSTGKPDLYEDLPQYVFSLAYHVLTVWFLAVRIGDRNDHVGWITKNLAWKDSSGSEIMEEQSQVTLDMMMRTAYLNLGETAIPEPFTEKDGRVLGKTWLLGLSIVTIETATSTGISRVTKRQASGTTYSMYHPQTIDLPPHHEASSEEERGSDMGIHIFPNHVLLQLTSSIAPTPSPMEAICLPEEEAVRRALTTFDRNDTVDGYKVGVIYIGNNQTNELPILANTKGSAAFEAFLGEIGTKIRLRGASFNTQGLDRQSDLDGMYTYAWRDRVTEIIFHVPTLMPTDLENDPACVSKKRHIGNDYVNIIWNESGHPFRFDTFASQFNCVNIVIVPDGLLVAKADHEAPSISEAFVPEKEPFYTIQVLTASAFPDISPVSSYKLLPFKALPLLTRQLALQASVFSNVWINRDTGEHASSWRNRLREIKRLRERYANTGTSTSEKYPGASSQTKYRTGDTFQGRVVMGGIAEVGEDLIASLDFSRWAGPNA